MNKAVLFKGLPKEILSDNGPEFTSNAMSEWAYDKNVQPVFRNIVKAREIISKWKDEYNFVRPQSSLDNLTPSEYAHTLQDTNFAVGT